MSRTALTGGQSQGQFISLQERAAPWKRDFRVGVLSITQVVLESSGLGLRIRKWGQTMKTVLLVAAAVLVTLALSEYLHHSHSERQIRVIVATPGVAAVEGAFQMGLPTGSLLLPKMEWANDFWSSCHRMAFATSAREADYTLVAGWVRNAWSATVRRHDSALIYRGQSPNYKEILRGACRAIADDRGNWEETTSATDTASAAEERQEQLSPTDRYDLRDLHNGMKTTTAILDKRTGRVWIWTELTDNKGKSTGETAFVGEQTLGSPIPPY